MPVTSYPKNKINILLLEGIHPSAKDIFNRNGYSSIEVLPHALNEKELTEKIKDVHLIGIRSKTHISKNIIENASKLLAAGCFCIGTNQVDLSASAKNGIAVFNSPYSNTRSVAELVIAYCIMLLRRIPEKNAAAHNGHWNKEASNSFEVRGKTIGIIGYGHIGSQVSVLAEAIGMHVIFYDTEPKLSLGNAKACKTLETLFSESDVITLHVPGDRLTKNLIGKEQLKRIKKGAVLINLSRGDVLNIDEIVTSLKEGALGGCAIDVFPDEPESNQEKFTSPLQQLSNVILTPHIGGSTAEAQENIGIDVASKLLNFLENGSTTGSLSVPALNLPAQHDAHRILHIHKNVPGVLSELNAVLTAYNANILSQYLNTNPEIGYVVLDIDKETPYSLVEDLKKVKHTIKTRSLY